MAAACWVFFQITKPPLVSAQGLPPPFGRTQQWRDCEKHTQGLPSFSPPSISLSLSLSQQLENTFCCTNIEHGNRASPQRAVWTAVPFIDKCAHRVFLRDRSFPKSDAGTQMLRTESTAENEQLGATSRPWSFITSNNRWLPTSCLQRCSESVCFAQLSSLSAEESSRWIFLLNTTSNPDQSCWLWLTLAVILITFTFIQGPRTLP